jgi:hypothetical protein
MINQLEENEQVLIRMTLNFYNNILFECDIVVPNSGVSVAERARLFGGQVKFSSASNDPKPSNQQKQRPPLNKFNNQSTKSNIINQDRNYQPFKTNVNRHPRQDTS